MICSIKLPPPPVRRIEQCFRLGFTLIELSIVIVIIGLIIGGVLVGRDLISAANIRAQISQIEMYKTAVNTFKLKYNYLPGDMPDTAAAQYGFTGNSGNGNGRLDGVQEATFEENALLIQLGQAGLIGGSFSLLDTNTDVTGDTVGKYLPTAKLGNGLYVYPWWQDYYGSYYQYGHFYNKNAMFFTVATVSQYCGVNMCGYWASEPTMKVSIAYNIDQKIDDGLPQSGKVLAAYLGRWAGFGGHSAMWAMAGAANNDDPSASTISASTTTCVDTGGVSDVIKKYSVGQDGGNGNNCALSFQF